MIVAVLIGLALVFIFVPCAVLGVRRNRTPRELRGDWWSKFEREFRAYASQQQGNRPKRPNPREERRPPR
jgi:hypothetical protein